MLLEGMSVVITGAGSGVGRAAALIFAREGARLVCADVSAASNEETAAMVRAAGGEAVAVSCNVSNEADVAAAIAKAVETYGRLDVMYNNAGIASTASGRPTPFHETDDVDFDRLNNVNFRGVFHGCRMAIRQFLKQGDNKGVIVNTASVAGMVGWGGTLYGATKGAVVQLTRGVAIENARHGIRVNSVCPAGMITNFGAEGRGEVTPELVEMYGRQHPLGQPISPEDCANAALFLASDMARNITGVCLPVDGGYVAG